MIWPLKEVEHLSTDVKVINVAKGHVNRKHLIFSGEMSSLRRARHIRRTHRLVAGLKREPLLSHVLAPCRRIRSQSSTSRRSHDSGLPDADVGIRRTAV